MILPLVHFRTPSFSTVTNSNCVDLPACFFLKMNRPMPFSLSFIQRMGNATSKLTFGVLYFQFINMTLYNRVFFSLSVSPSVSPSAIPVFETSPSLSPLYQLIVQSQLQVLEEGSSTPPPSHNMHFYSVSRHLCFLKIFSPTRALTSVLA